MATRLLVTVKPSGGDYTSLEACMNANEQNLVTNDKYLDVEIDGDWSGGADTTAVTIHNYGTDATRKIHIYTTAAARHPGYFSSSAYLHNSALQNLEITVSYLTITGVAFKNDSGVDSRRACNVGDGYSYIVIDKCLFSSGNGNALRFWNYTATGSTLRNSVFMTAGAGYEALLILASMPVNNCVAVATESTADAVKRAAGTPVVTNCYAHNGGTGAGYSASMTLTTCASSDGSQSTATVAYSTATFTNVTSGSEDFHLVSGSGLIGEGTDLSATFTDDIDGDTRAAWDIGVDYFGAAGTAYDCTCAAGLGVAVLPSGPALFLASSAAGFAVSPAGSGLLIMPAAAAAGLGVASGDGGAMDAVAAVALALGLAAGDAAQLLALATAGSGVGIAATAGSAINSEIAASCLASFGIAPTAGAAMIMPSVAQAAFGVAGGGAAKAELIGSLMAAFEMGAADRALAEYAANVLAGMAINAGAGASDSPIAAIIYYLNMLKRGH